MDLKSSLEDCIFCDPRKKSFTFSRTGTGNFGLLYMNIIFNEGILDQEYFIDVNLITFIIISTSFITITLLS
jgi:hypothetical protein